MVRWFLLVLPKAAPSTRREKVSFTAGRVTTSLRSQNGQDNSWRGGLRNNGLRFSTEAKAYKIGDRDPGSGSTCYQPPRESDYSRRGAPPRPGCVRGFCYSTGRENLRKEIIGLQRQQTVLQFQQNKRMELLAHNQKRKIFRSPALLCLTETLWSTASSFAHLKIWLNLEL